MQGSYRPLTRIRSPSGGSLRDLRGTPCSRRKFPYDASMMTRTILPLLLLLTFLPVFTGCASSGGRTGIDPWSAEFNPPQTLRTQHMVLEPLTPDHAQMDYDAFMSSREHLRQTLGWGGWPSDDGTVEENRADLERHWREHQANEAYTYAVLTPDRAREIGCVYLKPLPEGEDVPVAISDLPRPGVRIAYWVTAESLPAGLDRHLVERMTQWLRSEWGVESVLMPLHVKNERGMAIARDHGYKALPAAESDQRINYVWSK